LADQRFDGGLDPVITCRPLPRNCLSTGSVIIVVVCTRPESFGPWTIIGARDASLNEYAMWRKHTA
jgi:hypothetical protein